MVYKLNEKLYKKLVSINESDFESLLLVDGVPGNIRNDKKVIRKINKQHFTGGKFHRSF